MKAHLSGGEYAQDKDGIKESQELAKHSTLCGVTVSFTKDFIIITILNRLQSHSLYSQSCMNICVLLNSHGWLAFYICARIKEKVELVD